MTEVTEPPVMAAHTLFVVAGMMAGLWHARGQTMSEFLRQQGRAMREDVETMMRDLRTGRGQEEWPTRGEAFSLAIGFCYLVTRIVRGGPPPLPSLLESLCTLLIAGILSLFFWRRLHHASLQRQAAPPS